jgi:transketolase
MEISVAALNAIAARLRADSIRSTTEAGSGHPTTCCSCAEIMACLFFGVMRYDPRDPHNPVADRFVLSKGHAAPILYAAWKTAGYFTDEQLMSLRRVDSDLEGHPTPRLPFVDVATGSLGQGLGVGVGLALNARLDKTGYRTFVLMGDGETAEGAVWEAAQTASYYKLGHLVAIVDMNRLGQSQATMLEHDAETMRARFEAFGWRAVAVDGHDVKALLGTFALAGRDGEQPLAIIARTLKGKGVPFVEDKDGWHGKPFKKGEEANQALAALPRVDDALIAELRPPAPPAVAPPSHEIKPMAPPPYCKGAVVATREAYGDALVALGKADSRVIALDGDTKNSTFSEKFLKAFPDRFVEGFIAEQNLVSMAAGLAARGRVPFASSFAVFLSRGFDQVRMAGISGSNIKLCGSHVGVSIGEDGPSQMGLEDLALYRTIPGCVVFYPSDAVAAWHAVRLAAEQRGMAYIRTSRPKTGLIYDANETFGIGQAKVVRASAQDALTIVTGGVTLFEALTAAERLASTGIAVRIVDPFTIKPLDVATLAACARETGGLVLTVEDHYPEGGLGEAVAAALTGEPVRVVRMAVTEVPRSGSPADLMAKYGIDAAAIERRVKELVGQ